METIQKQEFHTIAPENNEKEKMGLYLGAGILILLVVGSIYYFSKNNKQTAKTPVYITAEQIAAFEKQVASNPNPKFTEKQIAAFEKQVESTPNTTFTAEQIAAFEKQVASNPNPIIKQ